MINSYSFKEFNKNKKLNSYGFKYPLNKATMQSINATGEKMVSIREEAKDYVSIETKNICELHEVSTELDIKSKHVDNVDPDKAFDYFYIIVEEVEYRVPKSVIKQLKAQLEAKPSSVLFKVTRSGEGMKTEYNVIMLD